MNEEKIIDGVDVARCKDFFEEDGCDNTNTLSCICSRNSNCYYKQYKRLEQENTRLKEQLSANPLFSDSWNNRLRADKYKRALQEIIEVVILDDVNCTISPETMNVCNDVLKIINKVLN